MGFVVMQSGDRLLKNTKREALAMFIGVALSGLVVMRVMVGVIWLKKTDSLAPPNSGTHHEVAAGLYIILFLLSIRQQNRDKCCV